MMDPDILVQCIPACRSIEKCSAQKYFAKVRVKFGIVPIRFNLSVLLANLNEPTGYTVSAVGQGGLVDGAGADGTVEFIAIDDENTRIVFLGHILKGSVLFELGEPLVKKTANKWFGRFFLRFEDAINKTE